MLEQTEMLDITRSINVIIGNIHKAMTRQIITINDNYVFEVINYIVYGHVYPSKSMIFGVSLG